MFKSLIFSLLFLCATPLSVVAQTRKPAAKTTRTAPAKKTPVRKTAPRKAATSSKAKKPDLETLKRERTSLQKNIKRNETLLVSVRGNVKSQLHGLGVLGGKIERQLRVIDTLSGDVRRLSQRHDSLASELTMLERQLQERRQRYRRSMLFLYRNRTQGGKLLFLFSAHSFHQMARRWRYVRDYAAYQRVQGEQVERKASQVEDVRLRVQRAREERGIALERERKERATLERQQREKEQLLSSLRKKEKSVQSVIAANKKRYTSLSQQIDRIIQQQIEAERRRRQAEEAARLKREAEERRRQAEAAARRAGRPVPKVAPSPAAPKKTESQGFILSAEERALAGSFAANRGRLPIPITGPYMITSHYGQYNMDGMKNVKLDNKGINITGKAGAQARAIFQGEVTAVFQFGGLHNVIVRHGSYISVYCNLSSLSVRKGQKVSARQVLGAVAGDAGGDRTLFFQLRKEREKLNPEQWLGR